MAQTGIDQGFQADSFQFPTHWVLLSLEVFFIYLEIMLFSLHFCKNKRTFVVQNSSVNDGSYLLKRKHIISVFLAFHALLLTHPGPLKSSAVNMVLQGQGQGQEQEQGQSRADLSQHLETGAASSPLPNPLSKDCPPGRSCCLLGDNGLRNPTGGRTQQLFVGATRPRRAPLPHCGYPAPSSSLGSESDTG